MVGRLWGACVSVGVIASVCAAAIAPQSECTNNEPVDQSAGDFYFKLASFGLLLSLVGLGLSFWAGRGDGKEGPSWTTVALSACLLAMSGFAWFWTVLKMACLG